MKKNLALIIVVVLIIVSIWYIESTKARPGATDNSNPSQALNIDAATSSIDVLASSGKNSAVKPSLNISDIAAADKKAGYQPAIEISNPTDFINASSSFLLKNLIGKKIILLDFWTYSCINCIRTLPYLNSWYQRYRDEGLEIVGIHTPEFDFEKRYDNVKAATEKFGIKYPVVLDSDYGTWTAYSNQYWPHEYLIDLAGYIVHDQIGEGNYGETETEIQKLLAERSRVLGVAQGEMLTSTVSVPQSNISGGFLSPETYFGAARNQYLANGVQGTAGSQNLQVPQNISLNSLYLTGSWNFQNEYATNNAVGTKIIYKYNAARVYFVADAPKGATIEIFQDGQPVSAAAAGSDVHNGKVTIQESRLYNIIDNRGNCSPNGVCSDGSSEHTLEIIIDSPGLDAYTFTFG
ncbi:MAG: redoxin domain-containing protein [Patescibacteria group bacterium]|nr:redoxin domain-containing protein [Patescibacteria group bacterium]MDE2015506.1 redoxin domain-containing protein [Patescibacteria group bacterium]MDE2226878.1 redoxin domain-containing protein [Patescibacteria group bacterium]